MNANKVDRYIAGIFPKKNSGMTVRIPWFLFHGAAISIGVWALFFGGPPTALAAAHAMTWAFILLDITLLSCVAFLGICRTCTKDNLLSDQMLFSNTRAGLFSKLLAFIDTPMYLTLALMAGWQVAAVALMLLFFLEITSQAVIKNNQNERRAELELIPEEQLSAQTEQEALRQQIDSIFKENS